MKITANICYRLVDRGNGVATKNVRNMNISKNVVDINMTLRKKGNDEAFIVIGVLAGLKRGGRVEEGRRGFRPHNLTFQRQCLFFTFFGNLQL